MGDRKQEALEMQSAGVEVPAIAEELGVSISTVYRLLGEFKVLSQPKGWEEAQKFMGDIVNDYLDGELSLNQIAEKYGTTRYCVEKTLKEEGVLAVGREAQRSVKNTHEEAIVEAYNGGMRIVDISMRFSVGQGHIYTILARHGIRPGRRLEAIRRAS